MYNPEHHCDTVASTMDDVVRLVRCTSAHGLPHYRVTVAGLVDKRHANLNNAATHYSKAVAAHLRYRYNEK